MDPQQMARILAGLGMAAGNGVNAGGNAMQHMAGAPPAPMTAPPASMPMGAPPAVPMNPAASQQMQRMAPPSGNLMTPQPMNPAINMMQSPQAHAYTSQEARDIMNQVGPPMKPWTAPTPQQMQQMHQQMYRTMLGGPPPPSQPVLHVRG